MTSQINYLTSNGRSMPPYLLPRTLYNNTISGHVTPKNLQAMLYLFFYSGYSIKRKKYSGTKPIKSKKIIKIFYKYVLMSIID